MVNIVDMMVFGLGGGLIMGSQERGALLVKEILLYIIHGGGITLNCLFWIKQLVQFVQMQVWLAWIIHQMIHPQMQMIMESFRGPLSFPLLITILIVVP